MRTLILPWILLACLWQVGEAKEVPRLEGPAMDTTGTLSAETLQEIDQALRQLQQRPGPQFQLLVVGQLDDETIESYSIKVVDQWKIGNKDKDDGLLFLVSLGDRKMRLEVGQGLEGEITDAQSARIIRQVGVFFREGDYDHGIKYGLSKASELAGQGPLFQEEARPVTRGRRGNGVSALTLIFLIIFLIVARFFSFFDRSRFRGGGWGGGGGFGGGGFGGGGGGGWSGGGGGFSGGGSSGSW